MLINFTESENILIDYFFNFMKKLNQPQTIYFCGGFVRDKLLKRIPNDIDVIVHSSIYYNLNLDLSKTKKINIKNLIEKNKTYGTKDNVKMLQFFYNSIKVDIKIFETNLYEDIKERDFTINSLYYNIWDQGINDLTAVY